MAKCRFALYDPAQVASDGSYWAWREASLDVARLDRLYYEAASKHRPPDLNRLPPEEIWGGIADLGDGLIGVYRYFDGGRDLMARPGRFVILATLLTREEVGDGDLTAIFRCETARWVARRAPAECPLSPPPGLDEQLELPPAAGEGDRDGERLDLDVPEGTDRAGRRLGPLPVGRGWHRMFEPAGAIRPGGWIHREDRMIAQHAGVAEEGATGPGPGAVEPGRQGGDRTFPSPRDVPWSRSWPPRPAPIVREEALQVLRRLAASGTGRLLFSFLLVLLAVDIWLFLGPDFAPSPPARPVEYRNRPDPDPGLIRWKPGAMSWPGRSHPGPDRPSPPGVRDEGDRDPGPRRQPATPEPQGVGNTLQESEDSTSAWSRLEWLGTLIAAGVVAAILLMRGRRS